MMRVKTIKMRNSEIVLHESKAHRLEETRLENSVLLIIHMIYNRIFIFLLVGGNSPREFRAWMHSELHSPPINHPGEFRAWMHSELHSPPINHPGAENGMNKTTYNIERPVLPYNKHRPVLP
jgi:hypothetical protein